jgi:hypothetical protein
LYQAVLLRGTNDSAEALLDLCFALLDGAGIMPTAIEADDELALGREYPYYDPIYMLSEPGQAWWRAQRTRPGAGTVTVVSITNAAG